jgi:hypothetical protein
MALITDENIFDAVPQSTAVMQQCSVLGSELARLKYEMDEAEIAFNTAKARFMTMQTIDVPNFFQMNGLKGVTLEDGTRVEIKNKYHCSPNKNPADRAKICKWLKEHCGDYLIKENVIVDPVFIGLLEENNVKYAVDVEVNTNSLKAFLKSMTGEDGTIPHFDLADIPNEVHFIKVHEAEVIKP